MNKVKIFTYYLQQFEYDWERFEKWCKRQIPGKSFPKPRIEGKTAALRTPKAFLITSVANWLSQLGYSPIISVKKAYQFVKPFDWFLKLVLLTFARIKLVFLNKILVIGITGSYGKTSTKNILRQLLEPEYKVLAPPGSWNTITALAWLIIRQLKTGHEVLIIEMGAYKKGEIAQLCQLVRPKIGILTDIGPMHLERFGSIEAITDAKTELLAALPKDGLAIVNGMNQNCVQAAKKSNAPVVWWAINSLVKGISNNAPNLLAKSISITQNCSIFDLQIRESKKTKPRVSKLKTSLLGKAAIRNILPTIAVLWKLKCNLSFANCQLFEQIAEKLIKLSTADHRMQIVRQDGLMTIFDNSYSSNPAAAANSLEVLRTFPGRKIVITPGFIELGELQYSSNAKYGKLLAKSADYVFVVGDTNKKALMKGLVSGGLISDRVITVANRDQAASQLSLVATPGCVVLFENDLPETV